MPKVLIGLSGGIDSFFSAYLLKQSGFDVYGCFLQTGFNTSVENNVKKICDFLNISFVSYDVSGTFCQKVLNYFINSYALGLTPNPCLVCNPQIKFYFLNKIASEVGIDKIATGHYVRKINFLGQWTVSVAKDKKKDQSYFLSQLCGEDLTNCLFPLSDYSKEYVKSFVSQLDVDNLFYKESQDLCFVYDKDYRLFLKGKIPDKIGEIVDLDGKILGFHLGIHHFTPGQRQGLRIKYPGPWYVVKLDGEKNQVVVARGKSALYTGLRAKNVKWILPDSSSVVLNAKIRYNQPNILVTANVDLKSDELVVKFEKPVFGVAPGQFVVLYKGDVVVGSAEIVEGFYNES